MHKFLLTSAAGIIAAAAVLVCTGCDRLDNERIPVEQVNIVFQTVADWNIYGANSALTWNTFIRSERKPANFFYTAQTYTGYGGVLLVCDVLGNPQAFDLSCPVERSKDVRVFINEDNEYLAECPKCHSTYNVFSLLGHPVAGEAARQGYALRRYRVGAGRAGEYMVVSF